METIHARAPRARILIPDDRAIFAEALHAYLEGEFTVAGRFGSARRP
jgi:hypothetical protein